MRIVRDAITVVTKDKQEFLDITPEVEAWLAKHEVNGGLLILTSLHTTVALFVNEFQEALMEDLKMLLRRLVKEQDGYRHNDPRYSDCDRHNAASHLRATLLGQTLALAVSEGRLELGRWQSIILAELDGPRERTLAVQVIGD